MEENSNEQKTKQALNELNVELLEKINVISSRKERDNIKDIIPIYIGVIALIIVFYCLTTKDLYGFILCIFLICVFSLMAWGWVHHLEKIQTKEQENERIWLAKLMDAYGKLMENHIKVNNKCTDLKIQEIENQINALKRQSEVTYEK